ncbi:hypothetical protein ACEPAH_5133 [Sanghuangporus vaninii]
MSRISSSPSSLSVYQPRRTVSATVQRSSLTKKGLLCKNKVKMVVPSSETQLYTKKLVKVFCYLHKSQAEDDGRRISCPRPVEKCERSGDRMNPVSPSEAARPDSMSERIHSQHKNNPDLEGANGNKIQCNGTTTRGIRCRVQVKLRLPSNSIDPKLPLEVLASSMNARNLRKRASCLGTPTRRYYTPTVLQKEMLKPPSDSDMPGFVYTFQEVSSHSYNQTSMAPAAASASSTFLLYLEKKLSFELFCAMHGKLTCAGPRGLAVLSPFNAPHACLLVSCISLLLALVRLYRSRLLCLRCQIPDQQISLKIHTVKLRLPPSSIDPNLPLEVFCKYHKKIFEADGFISRRIREKVLFSDYIPEYLSRNTQAALRKEMMKPPSDGDIPGFVYAFQIRSSQRFSVKIGRTSTDLKRRLDEWKKA